MSWSVKSGKIRENGFKVSKNSYFAKKKNNNFPLVVIETPRRQTQTLEFLNAFRSSAKADRRKNNPVRKSQEISKVRSCDNPGCNQR